MPGHTGQDGGLVVVMVGIIHVVGIIQIHIIFHVHLYDPGEVVEDTPIQVLRVQVEAVLMVQAPQEAEADLVAPLPEGPLIITLTNFIFLLLE
jgi:hypothetical protein